LRFLTGVYICSEEARESQRKRKSRRRRKKKLAQVGKESKESKDSQPKSNFLEPSQFLPSHSSPSTNPGFLFLMERLRSQAVLLSGKPDLLPALLQSCKAQRGTGCSSVFSCNLSSPRNEARKEGRKERRNSNSQLNNFAGHPKLTYLPNIFSLIPQRLYPREGHQMNSLQTNWLHSPPKNG